MVAHFLLHKKNRLKPALHKLGKIPRNLLKINFRLIYAIN